MSRWRRPSPFRSTWRRSAIPERPWPAIEPAADLDRTRTELGARLRALRRKTGLTEQELAGRSGISQGKISRIETGRITASLEDVERLTQSLGAGADTAAALIDQAKTLASQLRTARAMQRQPLAGHQERIRELQAASRLIRVFQPTVVPGLLQTAEYARQVFLRGGLARSGLVNTAALAEAVTARLDRQAVLFDPSKQFIFLLTESALRTRICSRTAMQVQVDRILAMASLENVTVGYIPTGADVDVLPFNGFTMYDDQLVSVETISAQLTLRDERDIALYVDTFERLLAAALVGPAAFGALRDLYGGLGSDAEVEQEPARPATA